MAHSPGQWKVEIVPGEKSTATGGCSSWFVDATDGSGRYIFDGSFRNPDDANLIAAAPDLLEACEAVLGFEEAIKAPDCDDIERCRLWDDVLAAIRAAVAKYRGTVAAD